MISVSKEWNDPYSDFLGMKQMISVVTFVLKLMPIRAIKSKRVT